MYHMIKYCVSISVMIMLMKAKLHAYFFIRQNAVWLTWVMCQEGEGHYFIS